METYKQNRLSWFLRRRKSVHAVAPMMDVVAVCKVDSEDVVVIDDIDEQKFEDDVVASTEPGCKYDESEEVDGDEIVNSEEEEVVTDDVKRQLYGTDGSESEHDSNAAACCSSNDEIKLHDLIECLFAPDFDFNDKHMHCLNIIHDMLIWSVILLVAPIIFIEIYFRVITSDIVSHTYIESCYNLFTSFVLAFFVAGVICGVINIRMRRNL
jgi:hypothetical protein